MCGEMYAYSIHVKRKKVCAIGLSQIFC